MKKITLLLTLLVGFTVFAQFPAPYCLPTFTNNVEPLTLVQFAGINNSTAALPVGPANGTTIIAVEDYTAIIGNVIAGSSYPITLKGNTDGNFTTYYTVFVDWNHDADFLDANESFDIGTIINSTGTDAIQLTGSITVPPTSLTGNTRMRVMKRFNTYPTSCQTGSGFGQVEDYTLTVAATPPDLPDYANLQFPYTATISQGGSVTVYGQVYEGGLTNVEPGYTGQAAGISAWVGVNATDTNPNTWAGTAWVPATWNSGSVGNNDEYQLAIGSTLLPGTYYYATRFQLNGGAYVYGATNNGFWNGTDKINGVLTVNPPPPPANDDCSGAIGLTVNPDYLCGAVTAGTVVGATASATDATACFGTEDDDVWFSFVATNTTHRISLTNVAGSTTDMYHSLWTGTCAGLTLVPGSCSDADVSNPTALTVGLTYYLRVNTYTAVGNQTSTFNICIGTPPPPPTNDNLANAIAISCGNTYTGDTSLAILDEDNAPDGFGADMDAPNLWYSFTGIGTAQTVTLNLCGSAYDTSILIYTGTSGALTLVSGNDDDSSCNITNDSTRSRLTFTSDGTTTYLIAIEGWNVGSVGAFTMDVSCAAVNPPAVANQTCALALNVLVDGSDNNSDNSFGTINGTQPTCDTFGSIQDVWFSFVAPVSGAVTALLTRGTMTSLNYNVYSGACGSLTPIGNCTVNQLTATTTQSYTGLTAGSTYYLQVWSSGSEQGTFTLRLSDTTLGTTPFDASNFSYYPNPVKNILNLSYNQEISNVEVFNLLGQKVSFNKVNANSAQIDMANLANGAYMVKVTSNNQVKTIKVIKE